MAVLSQVALFMLVCLVVTPCGAQTLSQLENAKLATRELQEDGSRYEGRKVTLWVARDALATEQAETFLQLLDQGVEAIRGYLGPHVDEPVDPRRIAVFLSPRIGISHERGDQPTMVYMPASCIPERTAPYLHAFTHAIASWSWRHSEWLGEGFANHVAQAVPETSGGYHFSPVVPNGLVDVATHQHSTVGQAVLQLIGGVGRRGQYDAERAAIFERVQHERRRYATPFYALSWSFTDYRVAERGLDGIRAIARDRQAAEAGIAASRERWLVTLDGTLPAVAAAQDGSTQM